MGQQYIYEEGIIMTKHFTIINNHAERVELPIIPASIKRENCNFRIPLDEFTDEELRIVGQAWLSAFLAKGIQMRKDKAFYAEKNYHKAVMKTKKYKEGLA
jgi:hypothetical protein